MRPKPPNFLDIHIFISRWANSTVSLLWTLIASKYKTKVLSEFVEFEEHGTWPTDCISKYYKLEPSTSLLPLSHNQTPEGQKFLPFSFLKYFLDYECYTRKGVGKVRFSIPLNDEPGSESLRNISVDIYTTHTHSDEKYTGQASDKRVKQMNQIMPIIENSDAEVVILGGDFNDHPLSGKTIRKSKNWIRDEGIMRLGDWGLVGLGDQGIQGDGRIGALWDQGDHGEGCWGIRGIKGMGG